MAAVQLLVDAAVQKSFTAIKVPVDGENGRDGRDAAELEIMAAIVEGKRYPRGTWARYGGGLVRASIMACEEAEEEGRRPPLAARAGAALPRLLRMSVGTR
jgi:hypothetical protein